MGRQVVVVLYVVAMVAVVVGVDFAFFRNRFWERLTQNIGLVLEFGAFFTGDSALASMNKIRFPPLRDQPVAQVPGLTIVDALSKGPHSIMF